jgi:TonB family protein
MTRALQLALIVLHTFACATHQSLSRSVANTSLSGIVVDESGVPIAGAEVVAVTPNRQRLTATTANDGRFAFFAVEPGDYDVLAQKEDYSAVSVTNQHVRNGHQNPVELTLAPGRADKNLVAPRFLSGPSPKYTKEAFDHQVKGTVIAKCVITIEGAVRQCRILHSVKYMDEAVIAALQARRYQPATREGKPLEVDYTFKLNLSLP